MNPLLTATQIVQWADQRRAQEILPLLVRRLILGTADPLQIDFPFGDSINRPGWDGFLITTENLLRVPAGSSGWEMGTDKRPKAKADRDYANRKASQASTTHTETTFVFVTARRWTNKANWEKTKRTDRFWRDVIVLDADDLEQWLDRCPPVAVWARRQIGAVPADLRDLEEIWDLWKARTSPQLIPELLTAGRDDHVNFVRKWLVSPPSFIRIRADTADEAIGFIAAVTQSLNETSRDKIRARALVVTTPEDWRAVAAQKTPTILIAASSFGSENLAVDRGHHVAVVYGNDSGGVTADITLTHLRQPHLDAALRQMKLPYDQCVHVASESRGRLAAIVDLLGGGIKAPHWAAPVFAPQLLPFLLAGAWCQNPADVEAVAKIARISVDEMVQRLSRWANETDPPVRLVGGTWEWIARQRAWPHLSRHLTAPDLNAFLAVAGEVLGAPDPKFELPSDQRWLASFHNRVMKYSDPLRRGLAEALIMLSAETVPVLVGCNLSSRVDELVRNVFGLVPDPARWYALAPLTPLLAEAAPEIFLSALERDVVSNAAVRAAMFQDEGYLGGSPSCHLLWALETLAWSPDHLTSVSLVLAGLTANDPGGKMANRPASSLKSVFLAWYRGTSASVCQRLAAIDAINNRYPEIAFDLCARLICSENDTASPTSRPRWRRWAADAPERIPRAECTEFVNALFDRTLTWAGTNQKRWARLLNPMPHVDPQHRNNLLKRLEDLKLEHPPESTDDELRRAVRRILHHKNTIAGCYPDLTEDLVARLETIYARLEPIDVIARHAWLFDNHAELLSVKGNDWRTHSEALAKERQTVVTGLVENGGDGELLRLADQVHDAYGVGYHIGQSTISDERFGQLIACCTDSDLKGREQCAKGMIWGRFTLKDWAWVKTFFSTDHVRALPAHSKASFANVLPFESPVWDWVQELGEDVAAQYWKNTILWMNNVQRDATRAVQTLLSRGRHFAALRIVTMHLDGENKNAIGLELQLATLRAITAVALGKIEMCDELKIDSGFAYELGQLVTKLEASGVITEQELAEIEWVWLPAFSHTARGPATLHRMLAREPAVFAQAVSLSFRPDRSEKVDQSKSQPDKNAQDRAKYAMQLINDWHGIPGLGDNGAFDSIFLRDWVLGARNSLKESGHSEVGDMQIGEVLARSPIGTDGIWPHESVRSLLEELQAAAIERGVYFGVINGRGVTMRSPYDGGRMETDLANQYTSYANALTTFPRTASVLRIIAKSYREYARRQDDQRDLNEFYR